MANSYVTYTGTGAQRDFTVTFPFIARAHVLVYVDGVSAGFTWQSDSLVRLSSTPALGTTVLIKRTTPTDVRLADFANGGRLAEDDLDVATEQILYALQEDLESRGDALVDYSDAFGDITQLKAQVQTNVKYLKDYASFSAAVAAIGSTKCTLVVAEAANLTANVTIPATLTLEILSGGSIVQTGSYTLTIGGPFEAPLSQVFTGFAAGEITFTSCSTIAPEWWGITGTSDEDAINRAIKSLPASTAQGGVVQLLARRYVTDGVITMLGNCTLLGYGERATCIQNNGVTNTINIRGADTAASYISRVNIRGIRIKGTVASGYGVYLEDFEYCQISHCSVYNHGKDGVRAVKATSSRADQLSIEFTRITNNLGWGVYQATFGHQISIRDCIINSNGESSDIGTASGEGNVKLYASGIEISNSQFTGVPGVSSVVLMGSGAHITSSKFEGGTGVTSAATFLKLGISAEHSMFGAVIEGCIFAGSASAADVILVDIESGFGTVLAGGIFDAASSFDITAINVGAISDLTTILSPRMGGNSGGGSWIPTSFADPGRVLYLTGKCSAFRVKAAGTQTTTIGDTVEIAWATEDVDRGSSFATNVFTAPVAGLYQANVSIRLTGVDRTASVIQVRIQGGTQTATQTIDPRVFNADGTFSLSIGSLFEMAAGAAIKVYITQTGGTSAATIHADSVFSGFLVSA